MIDTVDYSILYCLHDSESALWKKKVYEDVCTQFNQLPLPEIVSVQTVGRRVDTLKDEELIDTVITNDPDSRGVTIGYVITEHGQHALVEKRKNLLREIAWSGLIKTATTDMSATTITTLLEEELGESVQLPSETGSDELAVLTAHYCLKQRVKDVNTSVYKECVEKVFEQSPLSESVQQIQD